MKECWKKIWNRNYLDDKFKNRMVEELQTSDGTVLDELQTRFFTNKPPDGFPDYWKSIREALFHLDSRIHYWEGRRTQFLQLTITLLGASLVSITAILTQLLKTVPPCRLQMITFFPPLMFSCILFISCLIMLLIWNGQNNPNYPFTKVKQRSRWQYRHAEKDPLQTGNIRFDEDLFEKEINKYNKNLFEYKKEFYNSDYKTLINTDLSQLYLLLINEKFKIKYVNGLRNGLYRSLITAFVFFFLGLIYSFFYY